MTRRPHRTKAALRRRIEDLEDRVRSTQSLARFAEDRAHAYLKDRQRATRRETAILAAAEAAGLKITVTGDPLTVRTTPARVYGPRDLEIARDTAAQAALALVIEALGIKGYAAGGYTSRTGSATIYDTARFEKDLRTALDVRAERAAEARRAATEKKVTGLVKTYKSKFTTGGLIYDGIMPCCADPRPDKTVDEVLDAAATDQEVAD